jgi:hypothetical protein
MHRLKRVLAILRKPIPEVRQVARETAFGAVLARQSPQRADGLLQKDSGRHGGAVVSVRETFIRFALIQSRDTLNRLIRGP